VCRTDARVCFVEGVNLDFDIFAKNFLFSAFFGESVEHRQRIRGHARAKPLDHVAIVVIVRRLDEHEAETLRRSGRVGHFSFNFWWRMDETYYIPPPLSTNG